MVHDGETITSSKTGFGPVDERRKKRSKHERRVEAAEAAAAAAAAAAAEEARVEMENFSQLMKLGVKERAVIVERLCTRERRRLAACARRHGLRGLGGVLDN